MHRTPFFLTEVRSKLLLFVFDVMSVLVMALLALPAFQQPAYAYVDPSVMTYTIQALAGVAVALSAVAGVAFRRTRKVLLRALHIDENANRIVDAEWKMLDGSEANLALPLESNGRVGSGVNADNRRLEQVKNQFATGAGRRVALSLAVVGFTVFTLFVVAPFEIVIGSEGSLVYGIAALWPPIVKLALALLFVGVILVSLFRGKAFSLVLAIVFAFGLCCYVQAMFLNVGLSVANGASVIWPDYKKIMLISTLVWLAIIVGISVVALKSPKRFQGAAAIASMVLILVQGVGLASLVLPSLGEQNDADEGAPASSYVVTQEGMFEVSSQSNVIVFVLDTYDTAFLTNAVATDPDMFASLTGFTWYRNSTGSMTPTRYGVPFLLTGQYPHEDEKWQTYMSERYKRSSFLSEIEEAGYSIGIYTDTLGAEYLSDADKKRLVYDKTINIHPTTKSSVNELGAALAMAQCALYRDLCWPFKPFLWFYTDEINQRICIVTQETEFGTVPYVMNDAFWYKELQDVGVSIADSTPAFRFIHMNGTHWPYNINELGEDVGLSNATVIQQSRGSLLMVSYYIDRLKELGVYDNSTIIITADHGTYYQVFDEFLDKTSTPIVIVKPAQSAELDALPLQISDNPVAAEDVVATVIEAVGGNTDGFGQSVFTEFDPLRKRYYLMTQCDEEGSDKNAIQYEITGDANDFSNWVLTGQKWGIWD